MSRLLLTPVSVSSRAQTQPCRRASAFASSASPASSARTCSRRSSASATGPCLAATWSRRQRSRSSSAPRRSGPRGSSSTRRHARTSRPLPPRPARARPSYDGSLAQRVRRRPLPTPCHSRRERARRRRLLVPASPASPVSYTPPPCADEHRRGAAEAQGAHR
eukprot:5760403-Pleurochrysis_carterae.AAC.2